MILALVLLLLCTILNYLKPSVGKLATAGILLLGVFNLPRFFPITFKIILGYELQMINSFEAFAIEVIIFALLMLHILLNYKLFAKLLTREITDEERFENERRNIDAFKETFSNKSKEELKVISLNVKLLEHARKAAEELLEELF